MITVAPLGLEELRTVDDDLAQLDARTRLDLSSDNIDTSAQTENEGSVLFVEYQVTSSQEHLSRCGDGGRGFARH